MNSVLEIKNVTKQFGDKTILHDLSFSVQNGDILGFIGPNGAGKSTFINIVSTLITADSGTLYFQNEILSQKNKEFKKSLGVVPQDLAIYEDLSAYDNVKFFCSLYGYKGSDLKQKVEQALHFVGLFERSKELSKNFSGGMKRRLNIACAIAHQPKLLIMDEPTVGIDPQSRNNILDAVKTLNKQGTTVIYVSHYMEEIETLCNRIVLLDQGRLIEDASKSTYKEKYKALGQNTLEDIFLFTTGTDLRDTEE